MFLRILNDEQKRALMVLAYHLVVTDHSVSKQEGELLDELRNGLRTAIPVTPQQLHEKPSLAAFDTREARVAAMLEILALAYCDDIVFDAGSKMIAKLATDFGFTDTEVAAMKTWGEQSRALLDSAQALMASG